MEVALTFGSLGDIVQVCQLAIQLGRAVGVGCGAPVSGSVTDYRQVRENLDNFIQVLMQVVAMYEQHELSPFLQGLDTVTRSVVHQCAALIQEALEHLQSRYSNTLCIEGSHKRIKDIYRRIEWFAREKERIRNLQEKLTESIQRLSLLINLASERSARVDNATMLARIDQVQQIVSTAANEREELLECLHIQQSFHSQQSIKQLELLERVDQQQAAQEKTCSGILASLKESLAGTLYLGDILTQVSHNVAHLQITLSSLASMRSLDPTKELPVILEDALGRQLPIPAQWIDSLEWEVLNGLLQGHFRGRPGYDMVRKKAYTLEEGATGKDLNTQQPLYTCLRRGMKVNMSMIFQMFEAIDGNCPRCSARADIQEGTTIKCTTSNCGMWFRIQKQHMIVPDLGPDFIAENSDPIAASMRCQPGDFQRVRLLRSRQIKQNERGLKAGEGLEPWDEDSGLARSISRQLDEQYESINWDDLSGHSSMTARMRYDHLRLRKNQINSNTFYVRPEEFIGVVFNEEEA